jgi:hypothetical protein
MNDAIRPRKKAPAGCLIPFGLIFFLAGLGICWMAWSQFLTRVHEVRGWAAVPCQVTEWEVDVQPERGNEVYKVKPRISYSYETGGKPYTGHTYDAGMNATPALDEFESIGATVKGGQSVCYVNPANPEESSYLRASYTAGGFVLAFGLVFASIGGMLVLGGFVSIFRRVTGVQAPVTRSSRGCAGGILAPVFFALFAIAGFAVWKLALHNQPDWKDIGKRMVSVPAKVIASGVHTSRSSGKNSSTTYKAKVAFRYDFNGRTWHSGWLDFDRSTTASSNYNKARDAASRFPEGASTTAWVNPDAPWQAVLEKEGGTRWWIWLFPIIFGGIGVLGLLGWLLKVTALGAALFGTRRIGG